MVSRKLVAGGVAGSLALAAVVMSAAIFRPDRAIRVATALVAHNVCAKSFVSGLDPQAVFAEIMDREGIRLLRPVLRYRLDRSGGTVDASVGGLLGSRAVFHDGLGCVLLHGAEQPYLLRSDIEALKASKTPPLLAEIAGPGVVEPADQALRAALDHAFEEPADPPFRRTKAVVVVHGGRVIAERYADGIGVDTPLLGFSLTKSVVNALLGILTQQGLVTPSMPAPVPEWRAATDPRREIEVEHLMRMTSGLALDETNSGFDPSSQMVYLHDNMAGFAAKAALIAAPGTRWAYSSPTTQLLARIIRDAVGGPEPTLAFAWRELFNPLGMRNVTLEFDATGTLQGSSYMLASARDWARFGLLYLYDGRVGGKRILHEDWVDLSAAATLDTDYGAGFWTNRSEHAHANGRVRLGIPRDAFFASGDLGQRIVILPSQNLVIVRLGDSVDPTGDIKGLARLVSEVIAATQK
ncbi:beta-lactamase family protein [Bradyrhizobium sediminis]|uniref:Beta-lactamase family protein n=1 Tax=Bradyrhizobium sediminis TaxID=2840469 RepID=A0A975NNQ2_9BRAD|nr:serine hydrolase [Bradyrhizobium sediminis]QWG18548.1 beta-lactamase family protein [Bradyrhizobium sediminis]